MMVNHVVNNLNTLCDYYGDGTDYNLLPSGGSGNVNVPGSSAFEWRTNDVDFNVLLTSLQEGGDFFYLGHGSPRSITPVPGSSGGVSLPANLVAGLLGNDVKVTHSIMHPYRLVIMDGCESYSSDWANAFGFAFTPNGSHYTVNDYYNFQTDPRAFVAWPTKVQAPDSLQKPTLFSSVNDPGKYSEIRKFFGRFDGSLAGKVSIKCLHRHICGRPELLWFYLFGTSAKHGIECLI